MNNAKLQLEVVSPTTIKCGHIEWFALDTKLVGKVKALLEENKKLKEHKYFTRQDALDEALDRIYKAIKEIDYFELKANHLDDTIYLDKELSNRLLDILRGEDER